MAETPEDPLSPPSGDPFDAPLPLAPPADPLVAPVISAPPAPTRAPLADPLGAPQVAAPVEETSLPFAPERDAGAAPPPVSFAPESVRSRDAADLPFALSPSGFSAPSSMGDATPELDDHEGIPTGLPDLRALAGIEVPAEPERPKPATPAPSSPLLSSELDEDLMALPSPSMMEASPFAGDDDDSDEGDVPELPETLDDVAPREPSSLHEDVTQEEQLPPRPSGSGRRDTDVVPARVMLEALRASERRHIVHLAVAFSLGAASSVLGFVAARWAMTNL